MQSLPELICTEADQTRIHKPSSAPRCLELLPRALRISSLLSSCFAAVGFCSRSRVSQGMEAFSRSEASVWLAEAAAGQGMELCLTPSLF